MYYFIGVHIETIYNIKIPKDIDYVLNGFDTAFSKIIIEFSHFVSNFRFLFAFLVVCRFL